MAMAIINYKGKSVAKRSRFYSYLQLRDEQWKQRSKEHKQKELRKAKI
jgi:hypothetical protein